MFGVEDALLQLRPKWQSDRIAIKSQRCAHLPKLHSLNLSSFAHQPTCKKHLSSSQKLENSNGRITALKFQSPSDHIGKKFSTKFEKIQYFVTPPPSSSCTVRETHFLRDNSCSSFIWLAKRFEALQICQMTHCFDLGLKFGRSSWSLRSALFGDSCEILNMTSFI